MAGDDKSPPASNGDAGGECKIKVAYKGSISVFVKAKDGSFVHKHLEQGQTGIVKRSDAVSLGDCVTIL